MLAAVSMANAQQLAASPVRWDVQVELREDPGFRRLPPIEQARVFEEVYSEAYDARNRTIRDATYVTLVAALAVLAGVNALVSVAVWRHTSP